MGGGGGRCIFIAQAQAINTTYYIYFIFRATHRNLHERSLGISRRMHAIPSYAIQEYMHIEFAGVVVNFGTQEHMKFVNFCNSYAKQGVIARINRQCTCMSPNPLLNPFYVVGLLHWNITLGLSLDIQAIRL